MKKTLENIFRHYLKQWLFELISKSDFDNHRSDPFFQSLYPSTEYRYKVEINKLMFSYIFFQPCSSYLHVAKKTNFNCLENLKWSPDQSPPYVLCSVHPSSALNNQTWQNRDKKQLEKYRYR
jgi:hypothetical protein